MLGIYPCYNTAKTLRATSTDTDAIAAASRKEQPWCSAAINRYDEGLERKACFKSASMRSPTHTSPAAISLSAKSAARNSS